MFKVVMACLSERNALALTVQYFQSVPRSDARTDAGNRNIKLPLKFFDTRPVAPPGTKEKFVILASNEGMLRSITSGQGPVSRREWQFLFRNDSSNTAGFADVS